MLADEHARQLHDRATRGEILSEDAQSKLDAWYRRQDTLETQRLGLTTQERNVDKLQAQVEAALTQLQTMTERIQEIASENETLRQEIVVLRRQLSQQPLLQPA